ncbi:MAG: Holliday junction branch migration protein RuvA [Calditrichaeota bacterium]|nr:MAG: Holliday junction branch migration protein RuvA [Calditrichota bacterium]MBL1206941.1 Holliday junction branch migration protein RuvA [Calditrichota bacterium]NOG46768.1 Holliday junction branch migration protein RuvA [Calditrichota bacterium]
MFEYINGIIDTKKPTEIVVDVNGVGYLFKISLSTYKHLPQAGRKVKIKSYLHVREDILQLFGFIDEKERDVFLSLLSISGIGPKLAQTILSGLTPDELINAIQTGNEKTLNTISGVGKKTAQRLVVELQDKFGKIDIVAGAGKSSAQSSFNGVEQETIMALISLGYTRVSASKAIEKAQNGGKIKVVEDLLKHALQVI